MPDAIIKKEDRWSSDVFMVYVRPGMGVRGVGRRGTGVRETDGTRD